jgi:hypothetical protein
MIFRRLAQHLREQNWTAIAIEFVLLIVGVFLGIQVANWNQSLADERLGRAYAQRLTADLERDLATRRELVAYYAAVLESVERTDALLADPQSDPKMLVVDAYRASEINYRAPSRATWEEVVASGNAGLLPREMAAAAADYFAIDTARDTLGTLSESAYRHRVRRIIPLGVQKALRAECSDVRDSAQQIRGFMPDCSLAIDPSVVSAVAAALRADPGVREDLRYQYSDVYSAHVNIRGDATAIEQALATLDATPSLSESTP